ncbi:MBL fold metallo-hydrolase [Labrenzia sp. PHM005]|uniref:MBL fold metallo-hydrolase n=1 Tax=Labrenzia sp. PHM005 TaxID=2590016 RepID=UPI00143D2481|nr:MBL fold metallo-hydrolase [Labrenzia sp. PHM005]
MATQTLTAGLLALAIASGPALAIESISNSTTAEQIKNHAHIEVMAPAKGFETLGPDDPDRSFHSDILYYETILSYGRNDDIRNVFLLINAYINANQQAYGIDFFERYLDRYSNDLDEVFRAQHLAALAILRATHADSVPLHRRIGWVWDTFDLLDEALALTGARDPLVHWSAGIIYTRVPGFFFRFDDALAHLTWLAGRPELEPLPGMYREVYRHLSELHQRNGDPGLAQKFRDMSGFEADASDTLFMNWFTVEEQNGSQMSAYPRLEEIVPGRIFALFGFGFSDVYFVLSKDGSQLIAVDAGTTPERLKDAHTFLLEKYPDLPEVGTLIITHAHWDHIGGVHYLVAHNPDLKIYGQSDFHETVERVKRGHSYTFFRGAAFHNGLVADYQPDVPVKVNQHIEVGGSPIVLVPQAGGETEDSLLVHFPDMSTVFVGDVLMPYYGEPWVEEGLVHETAETMEAIISTGADHVLHGHRPLSLMYTQDSLPAFLDAYEWLLEATQRHVENGYSANDVKRLNLIPPGFSRHPEAYLGYIAARDHLIERIADNLTGIWQEERTGKDPAGLDTLTQVEYGRMLDLYLNLSPSEAAAVISRMIGNGDLELAFKFANAAEARYGPSPDLIEVRNDAADRLRGKAQFTDPFKLVTYSEIANRTLKPMAPVRDHIRPEHKSSALQKSHTHSGQ